MGSDPSNQWLWIALAVLIIIVAILFLRSSSAEGDKSTYLVKGSLPGQGTPDIPLSHIQKKYGDAGVALWKCYKNGKWHNSQVDTSACLTKVGNAPGATKWWCPSLSLTGFPNCSFCGGSPSAPEWCKEMNRAVTAMIADGVVDMPTLKWQISAATK